MMCNTLRGHSVSRQSVCGRTHTAITCSVIDDRRKEQSVGVSWSSGSPSKRESSNGIRPARHGAVHRTQFYWSAPCCAAQHGTMLWAQPNVTLKWGIIFLSWLSVDVVRFMYSMNSS